jgi:3-hydroxybutyryl-CoA dehydrogenase
MSIYYLLVIGSGIMGQGIAYVGAVTGYKTTLYDVSKLALDKAQEEIKKLFEVGVNSGILTTKVAEEAMGRIYYSSILEGCASEANFVIEAVPEDLKLKKSVFEDLDWYTSPRTILATNTSTLSPTKIGSFTEKPDKVVAMNFFNPVPKMKLVEIIRGLETSDETVVTVREVAERMGKETVVNNEFP